MSKLFIKMTPEEGQPFVLRKDLIDKLSSLTLKQATKVEYHQGRNSFITFVKETLEDLEKELNHE